jgi:hypothetical protein
MDMDITPCAKDYMLFNSLSYGSGLYGPVVVEVEALV